MTQDEIRQYLGRNAAVFTQVANAADGSPEMAWGDTFFFLYDERGQPRKMPFATIVTKDYVGFDSDSNLNRGGLYRLNVDVGKRRVEERWKLNLNEWQSARGQFDFTAMNTIFPHPVYATYGWVSIINPEREFDTEVKSLLDSALERALRARGRENK